MSVMNRDAAWKKYAEEKDMPDARGFDYTRVAVEEAFKAGWELRTKDIQQKSLRLANERGMTVREAFDIIEVLSND